MHTYILTSAKTRHWCTHHAYSLVDRLDIGNVTLGCNLSNDKNIAAGQDKVVGRLSLSCTISTLLSINHFFLRLIWIEHARNVCKSLTFSLQNAHRSCFAKHLPLHAVRVSTAH